MAPSRGQKRWADGQIKSSAQHVIDKHRSGARPTQVKIDDAGLNQQRSKGTPGGSRSNLKERAQQLRVERQKLPIWSHQDSIKSKVRDHDVLLVVGETGSGKSTQIPQFLANEEWCKKRILSNGSKLGGCIAVTEPRRVAAISLARRVAEEMGTPLGNASPSSEVGYSVRFDNSTGPCTRIKFMTEGMLLQEMLRDPWLKEYSAVVVDEIHERGVNVDLVLAFLRRLQAQVRDGQDERDGDQLKLVIMSATADMQSIQDFLEKDSSKANGVHSHQEHTDQDWSGFSDQEEGSMSRTSQQVLKRQENSLSRTSTVALMKISGRQHSVKIHYSPQPVVDVLETAMQRIVTIHTHMPLPGDVLVFVTGQETVESLLALTTAYSQSIANEAQTASKLPKLLVLQLYAALPNHLQQRVFQPTPKFTRKIILATNIAETSITVPGIRYVVDTGKHKRRLFRPSLNLDSLLTASISRSSANQRSGRAGRDAPGEAYRMYTELDFYKLEADTQPEILRCDVSQLLLTIKSHAVHSLKEVPLLTTPPHRALERAAVHLLQLGALSSGGDITQLGREMSLLPLPSRLARILLSSAEPSFNCVDEIVDVVSALSVENIFVSIHGQQSHTTSTDDAADDELDPRLNLRQQLYRREGDHLTLLAAVQAYVGENADRKRWCEERGISHRAMQAVMDVRKQLTALMQRKTTANKAGNEQPSTAAAKPTNASDLTQRILKCLLTGLYTNVARLSIGSGAKVTDGLPTYTALATQQPMSIHPSSVLFGRKVEAIMGSEYVFTTKPYARCVSAVQLDWVSELSSMIT